MKHSWQATGFLIGIFILSQLVGIVIIDKYYSKETDSYKELPLNIERPEIEESISWIYILIAVLLGTALMFTLIKFKLFVVGKIWFYIAIWMSLTIAFNAFLSTLFAALLAAILTSIKTRHMIFHNLAEIFTYGGIVVLLHEMMSITVAIILLIAISIYDMIAVWQSKHMIKLAKFQTQQNMFAGAFIPPTGKKIAQTKTKSETKKRNNPNSKKTRTNAAILGGGDMAFPLLFSSAIFKTYSFTGAFIITTTAAIALTLLFLYAKKGKFYPAMPYISAGCFVGYGIVLLVL